MASLNGAEFFDVQIGSGGGPRGPKLMADLHVPHGYGVTWIASDGKHWKQRLAQNSDGTTWYDENGRTQLELVEVIP